MTMTTATRISKPLRKPKPSAWGECFDRPDPKPATVQVDVIVVEPNGHGIGWASYACERSFARTDFRSHMTLAEFARKHFGTGTLCKIGDGRYAVIVATPNIVSD